METVIGITIFILIFVPATANVMTSGYLMQDAYEEYKEKGAFGSIKPLFDVFKSAIDELPLRPIFRPVFNLTSNIFAATGVIIVMLITGRLLFEVVFAPLRLLKLILTTKQDNSPTGQHN